MKAFRTGVQAVIYEKQMVINAAGFGRHLNFNNIATQFEWIISSIEPQISTGNKEMRKQITA